MAKIIEGYEGRNDGTKTKFFCLFLCFCSVGDGIKEGRLQWTFCYCAGDETEVGNLISGAAGKE